MASGRIQRHPTKVLYFRNRLDPIGARVAFDWWKAPLCCTRETVPARGAANERGFDRVRRCRRRTAQPLLDEPSG